MKKIILLIFMFAAFKVSAQTYSLNYDSVRVGKTPISSVLIPDKIYIKGLPKGNISIRTDGKLIHNDTVYAVSVTGGYARKDSTFNINKNLYDVQNKVTARKNLGTLDSATNKLSYTPENIANKTSTASSSTTTYPNWLGLQNAIAGYVPYIGAIANLNLGIYGITSGQATINSFTYNPTAWAALWSFGDSITYGYNASTPSLAYVNLLGTSLGLTANNKGTSGAMAADQQDSIYSVSTPATNRLNTYMIGTNDVNIYLGNADKQANFKSMVMAGMAWLTIPNTNKTLGQSGSITYSGTWSNSPYFGGIIGKVSNTNGDNATLTLNGSVLYLGYTLLDGNLGQFSVTVDGVSKGTYQNYGQNSSAILTFLGKNNGSGLIRIPNLSSGVHTVVITVTSATSASNKVYIDWAAGNGNISASYPYLVQGGVPVSTNANAALVPTYGALVGSAATTLQRDGLRVYFADVYSAMNPNTDLIGDGIHPNDTGMGHVYTPFRNVITAIDTNAFSVNVPASIPKLTTSRAGFTGINTSTPLTPLHIVAPTSSYDAGGAPILPLLSYYSSTGLKTYESRFTTSLLAFGTGAGSSVTTGLNNSFLGTGSGFNTTSGTNNSFFGNLAGYSNTTGSSDAFFGYRAGYSNTTGTNNSFFGFQAGNLNTTGIHNSFFGQEAGAANLAGADNSFLGFRAGTGNTSGSRNTFLGSTAGFTNTTGNDNFFAGASAGFFNLGGTNGIFIGNDAGRNNTSGTDNIYFGFQSGYTGTTGTNNIFFGNSSGRMNTSGTDNFFGGFQAGMSNTTGMYGVSIGRVAGISNTTGVANINIGYLSGRYNITGSNNIAIGREAGQGVSATSNITGNTLVGYRSGTLLQTGANFNTLLGFQSGDAITTGASNIVIGNDIDAQSATASNQLNIGNAIYGVGLTGTGITPAGRVGIKVLNPTAALHLPAGTAAASTAALKFSPGGVINNPAEAGAFEATNSSLFYTDTISGVKTRREIVLDTKIQTITNKTVNGVTPSTMAFLDATSSIQTQLNSKESSLTFNSPISRSVNTISIPAATTSVNGYLTSTDWNTFNNKADSTTLVAKANTGLQAVSGAKYFSGANVFIASNNFRADNQGQSANIRILMQNVTAATSTLNQYSPSIRFQGQGWNTTTSATAAPVADIFLAPYSGANGPGMLKFFMTSFAGGVTPLKLYTDGNAAFTGRDTASAHVTIGGTVNQFVDGTGALQNIATGLIIGTPTIVAGAGAGTSPTISVTTNGKQLQVTLTVGTLPTGANAVVGTVTLANALSYTPYPGLFGSNNTATLLSGATMCYASSTGPSNITITSGTTALPAGTYIWNIVL